jgi:hypothetical protein
VNLSKEFTDLIVHVRELNIMLLQLLLALLQVLNLQGLSYLQVLELLGLRDGGLICLMKEIAVPEQLRVMLARVAVHNKNLLVLVTNATLKGPQLLA